MRQRHIVALLILIAFSCVLFAGSCDVDTKKIRLRDVDKDLKKYAGTKWNGLKSAKVRYAVGTGSKKADAWAKRSAVIFASIVQAEHVADVAAKQIEKLKKKKNNQARKDAEKAVKDAEKILAVAIKNGPKLVEEGKDLVANYKDLVSNPTKAGAVFSALSGSVDNLYKGVERAPKLAKKLTKIGKKLAKL
jgi:hypothetical protein